MFGWSWFFPDHSVGFDRAGDVFEVLLAQIGKLNPNLAPNVIVGRRRDADTAGLCHAFEPRRNIHAVPEDIMGLDDYVADIDAHTESNAPVLCIAGSKVVDAALELHSSTNRFDSARKLRQEAIASVFDNPAAVLSNCRGNSIGQERCHFGMRSLFVTVHQP